MSAQNFIYIETIEDIIKNSRDERNYIRCRNIVDFLKNFEKNNPVAIEYDKKLKRINMNKEFKKRASQYSSRISVVAVFIEILSLYMWYSVAEYMMWHLWLNLYYTVLLWIVFYTFFRLFVRRIYDLIDRLFW